MVLAIICFLFLKMRFPAIIAIISISFNLNAQIPLFRNFSLNEGLPQSQVNTFASDANGYLWVGTRGGGVARFDGKNFEVFTKNNGLYSDFILTLWHFNDELLIGTNKGLNYYNHSSFLKIPLLENPITAITQKSDNELILANGNSLVIFKANHSVEKLPFIFSKETIISALEYRNDSLFVGTDEGLTIFSLKLPLKSTFIFKYGKNKMRNTFIRHLAQWKDGILLGTYGDGIYYYKNGTVNRFKEIPFDKASIITKLQVFDENEIWVGTQTNGTLHYSNNTISYYSKSQGICSDNIISIHKDKWKNIWLGSSGQGFSMYREHPVIRVGTENNPGAVVYSISEIEKSKFLITSNTNGIYYFENGKLLRPNIPDELRKVKVRCCVLDTNNNIWLGTDGNGLWILDSKTDRWHNFTTKNRLNGNWIACMVADTNGSVWAGFSGGGIANIKYDQNIEIKKYKTSAGLQSDRITGLCLDSSNVLWYACDKGGIGRIKNEKIKSFKNEKISIRHLIFSNNMLLAATPEGIVSFNLKGKIVKTFSSANNELSSDNVYVLVKGGQDTLWAAQHNGVDMLIIQNQKVKSIKHIARESGFLGMEAVVRSGLRDKDGNIWIGTVNGLYLINPNKLSAEHNATPKIYAKQISILNVPIEKTIYANDFLYAQQVSTPTLSFSENQISFEAVSVYPQNPEAISYSWRLKGLEKKWSNWESVARSSYSNLSPGQYELQVKVINRENLLTQQNSLFTFIIDAPYWQKTWFILLVYGGSIFLLSLTFIVISINYRRRIKRKNERLFMEKNIVSLRQKALRLQMNPHFIFHSLNSIQNLVINKKEENARQYISRFSKLMRDLVELASAENITLKKEIESLQNYLELEKLSRDNSFDFELVVGKDVEDELVAIPPLILQPLVENALVHGFKNITSGGLIQISITQSNEIITILIEDNGIGFDLSINSNTNSYKTSTALKVTRERLELHYANRFEFTIKNIEAENKTGTIVSIKLFPAG